MRPESERFQPNGHGVELLDRVTARRFVEEHHYSASWSSCRLPVGLFFGRTLVGVGVFGNPTSIHAADAYFERKDGGALNQVEVIGLNRFVLLEDVKWNGETWFLARCRELLLGNKPGVLGIVSYSDPVPRFNEDGERIMPGHIGRIYQAHNGVYVGRSKPDTKYINPKGLVIDRRTTGKIRLGQRGADEAFNLFRRAGAPAKKPTESFEQYVLRALREGPFTPVKHKGNHVYCWTLSKKVRVKKPPLPYPKQIDELEIYDERDHRGRLRSRRRPV